MKNSNSEFFNRAYKKKNLITLLLHPVISFNQQCKAKPIYKHAKVLLKNINSNNEISVLDYGFGLGSFLLKLNKRIIAYGVELSEEAMKNIARISGILGKNIRTLDFDKFPVIVKGKIDILVSSHVLEHVDDEGAILESFKTALKYDGKLVLNLPINELFADPNHVRKYDKLSIEKVLEKAGFRIEYINEYDRLSGLFILIKIKHPILYKVFLRPVFPVLALAPYSIVSVMDNVIKNISYQQILVIASKYLKVQSIYREH